MLRYAMAVLAVSLSLAGCQASLPQACQMATAAHTSFTVLADAGEFTVETVKAERLAFASFKPVCDNPAAFDPATALPIVLNAYVVIRNAMRESDVAYATLRPYALGLERILAKARE